MSDVSDILRRIDGRDDRAAEKLLPLVYDELRRLAAQKLANERAGQTLQATALVHEAFLRLVGPDQSQWNSAGHFFAAASEAMRRVLIENARRKKADKRGGKLRRVDLEDADIACEVRSEKLLALDEALSRLAEHQPQKAELVKLRYFAGLTNREAATALGISTTTADRYWAYARAWLQREMANQPPK